ncbi:MAG: hypothetical protein ABEJ94_00735 [Halorientalis sp.]
MISRSRISAALLVLGAVLLLAPALAPVQPVLSHEVAGTITADRSDLRNEDIDVMTYENLSERGKVLYERTLRNGGSYRVPVGEGAPEFQYRAEPTPGRDDDSVRAYGPRTVAIEPPDDADFPVVDERVRRRRPPDGERRETNDSTPQGSPERYTIFRTSVDQPPLTDPANLLRFLSVLAGVVAIGGGGYLGSRP